MSPHGALGDARFGRLFKQEDRVLGDPDDGDPDGAILRRLAAALVHPQAALGAENTQIGAAYTYFGQFIDHDLTFDATTIEEQNDLDELPNLRTARFDLDALYGAGLEGQPYLYDGAKLIVGGGDGDSALATVDLWRNKNGRAIIGDPRNDEHLIICQMHLLWVLFHNLVVDRHAAGQDQKALYAAARRSVVWHYQWLVLNDYLPKIIGKELATKLRDEDNRKLTTRMPADRALPMEFAHAAFRFGHTMVRSRYKLRRFDEYGNDFDPLPIFGDDEEKDLRGFRPLPANRWLFWTQFLQPNDPNAQSSMAMDHRLSPALANVPVGRGSLPDLNLRRGVKCKLPAGNWIAEQLELEEKDRVLEDRMWTGVQFFDDPDDRAAVMERTPLWFYILREAATVGGGAHLGPVGGHIVGEVILHLLENDPDSYLTLQPGWKPDLWSGTKGSWRLLEHQGYVHYKASWDDFWDDNDENVYPVQ